MKLKKSQYSNLLFLVIISLLLIPQTRKPIQVFLQKGLAQFSPSVIDETKQKRLTDYNWKLKNLDGEFYDFNETQGRVVLVNFWATWCPPCIAELPSLSALYEDYKQRVEFIFITNEDSDKVTSYLDKNDINIPVFHSLTVVPKMLETTSIPRTLLIDKDGTIIIDKTGAANWGSDTVRAELERLLAQ